jgi:hypothetical protein
MPFSPLGISFGQDGLFYGLVIPLVVVQLLALLLIPALLRSTARVDDVARAVYACLAKTLGGLLMSAAVLPVFVSILTRQGLGGGAYTVLLLMFAVGALVFMVHETMLRGIDPAARAVPSAIFFTMWKVFGLVLALFSLLTFLVRLMVGVTLLEGGAWALPLVLFVYGKFLLWLTWEGPVHALLPFHSKPLAPRIVLASKMPFRKAVKAKKRRR